MSAHADGASTEAKLSELQASFAQLKTYVESNFTECKQLIKQMADSQATPAPTDPSSASCSSQGPLQRRPPALQYQQEWGKIVELNVGGQCFTTALDTLTQQPDSMLAAMFSGRHAITVDPAGRAFIDRDSELFRHVLAFLREGSHWQPPSDQVLWARLQREFEFYNLTTGFEEPSEATASESAAQWLMADEEAAAAAESDGPPMRIFALGGHTPGTFARYMYDVNQWAVLPPPPSNFSTFMAAAALGGHMYVCGGRSTARPLLTSLERFNPVQSAWQALAPMPAPRGGHAAAGCRGSLYVVGGKAQGQYLSTMAWYSPTTDTWLEAVAMASPRDGLAVAEMEGVVYALGGKANHSEYLDTEERYDPREGVWRGVARMRSTREGHAAVAWMGRLWAVGGSAARGLLREVESYDPRADAWTAEAPLAAPKFGHSAVVVGGQAVVMGGSSGRQELRELEVLPSPARHGVMVPPPAWRARGQAPAEMEQGRFWGVAVAL